MEAEKDPNTVNAVVDAADRTEAGEAESSENPEAPVETEPPTKSYDDFLLEKEAARARLAELVGGSKAARAVDTSNAKFAGLVIKESEDLGDFIPSTKGNATTSVKKDQRSMGKTTVDGISFKFEAPSQRERDVRPGEERRGGRTSGDRGRGGGRREGSGGRGGRGGRGSNTPATGEGKSVLNSTDFPTLA